MRISRLLLATAAAVLCFAVTAVAQTAQYDIRGSVTVTGGSKKKPKPGGLTFGFSVAPSVTVQPPPLQTYSIAFEGGRMNLNVMKSCSAAKINAANQGDDSVCPKGSKIGTGSLDVAVGAAGSPLSEAAPCKAHLTLYAAGKGHASLFVKSTLAECPAAVHQAIDMQYFVSGEVSGLKFTVPQELRHQIGLDLTVTNTDVTIPKVVKKMGKGKKAKKVGLLESTGCKDGQRDLVVTFTDEQGNAFPQTQTLGKC